ncbi:hypothetical protein [Saccharothrix deserti]|uniref:hypothetical protein n=1 Tax=Saccharothrix deserti TaxID=2593674 RepID=UPI00131B6D01|nr:hypothetical protein [Saccharothrix deserti]
MQRNAELERDLLPVPPVDFLRHPSIAFQMFVNERLLPHELPYVRSRLTDERLLAEPSVGEPPTVPLPDGGIRTSSNTVHQLFHLLRYQEATGRRIDDAATIVEWGGGFGALMRLIVAMHSGEPTCVIFDTPIFSAVQPARTRRPPAPQPDPAGPHRQGTTAAGPARARDQLSALAVTEGEVWGVRR